MNIFNKLFLPYVPVSISNWFIVHIIANQIAVYFLHAIKTYGFIFTTFVNQTKKIQA